MVRTRCTLLLLAGLLASPLAVSGAEPKADKEVRFSREVVAIFSRLGCNGGTCHGAVQGQNGFRLTLFGTDPEFDYAQVVRSAAGRRINRLDPEQSLLLLKPSGQVAHGGGQILDRESKDYELLKAWLAANAPADEVAASQLKELNVSPAKQTSAIGQSYQLNVEATFADGSREDVTHLCSFESQDPMVAQVYDNGEVETRSVGEAPILVRYRDEPRTSIAIVPRTGQAPFPAVASDNFIDRHILAKLKELNIPPSAAADDAAFLRRARLDVTGKLPTPDEVRAFLADDDPQKRTKKIEQLLQEDSHAALWTLKFCDLLKAKDFGVYADGMKKEQDVPRFQAWIRARLEENLPYDELVARILTATSREGRSLQQWAQDREAMEKGYGSDGADRKLYAERKTLDLFWQRKSATGVSGTLQIAHAFLGLRLECAQCHRHPHDVWQQDDLLSFANFFTRVRQIGFKGDNKKKYPKVAEIFDAYEKEGKALQEEAKKLKGKLNELRKKARQAKQEADKLRREIAQWEKEIAQWQQQAAEKRKQAAGLGEDKKSEADALTKAAAELDKQIAERQTKIAEHTKRLPELDQPQQEFDKVEAEIREKDQRGKMLPQLARRLLHTDIHHVADEKIFASVTSPLGTQSSQEFRLLGETEPVELGNDEDPRQKVVEWLRKPDNPYFAKAIVNRVWAHYFGRGIIDPPDNLSAFNPASHPELLDQLCREFVAHKYDLRWLHQQILTSRTYQQASAPTPENAVDRANYAYFYYRRLPAEVLLDALNQATGTTEKMDMKYHHWPEDLCTVEIPFAPRNDFVKFVLEQFGRPARNSAVQCDCERDGNPSVLQVLTLANHPHVWEKIRAPGGHVARLAKQKDKNDGEKITELYLHALSRLPTSSEREACLAHLGQSKSAEEGLAGVMWSLINTREFLLQH